MEMEATQGQEGKVTHLPECSESMIPDFHNERWICICAPLRACEARVYDERNEAWVKKCRASERHAYAAALDAAEAAVREQFWPSDGSWVTEETSFDSMGNGCVAAIRGLREEQK